jgi:predicted RNase H-like HicB family nuclease
MPIWLQAGGKGMLTQYLNEALERARYEFIEDDEPYYGEIPEIEGVWATGKTLEECRRKLAAALEDWLFFSIARGLPIPTVGGIELKSPAVIVG